MKRNRDNIFVIAQKEFADCIWSPRFWLILGIFMAILLLYGYTIGMYLSGPNETPGISPVTYGFMMISDKISEFGALVAIAIGFDAIGRERKSGSFNVLLTHPVFRDLIITGKFVGMAATLGLVTVISVMISSGLMLYFSGITVSAEVIYRIAVYMMMVFLFMLSYLALSIAISTITTEPSHALFYSVALWLILALLLPSFASITAEIITGKSLPPDPDNFALDPSEYVDGIKIRNGIIQISPSTHFEQLLRGAGSLITMTADTGADPLQEMIGLFDTRFTLGYWFSRYWANLVALIVMPVILLIISYMAFLRTDITL